jgi:hypothetical protein
MAGDVALDAEGGKPRLGEGIATIAALETAAFVFEARCLDDDDARQGSRQEAHPSAPGSMAGRAASRPQRGGRCDPSAGQGRSCTLRRRCKGLTRGAAHRQVRAPRRLRGIGVVRGSPEPRMPSCRRAGARRLSSQPRWRSAGRMVRWFCRLVIVLPSARMRGWEDSQRAPSRAGRRAWVAPGAPRRLRPGARSPAACRAGLASSAGLSSRACPPAAVLAHGVCPPSLAAARPGGRCCPGALAGENR